MDQLFDQSVSPIDFWIHILQGLFGHLTPQSLLSLPGAIVAVAGTPNFYLSFLVVFGLGCVLVDGVQQRRARGQRRGRDQEDRIVLGAQHTPLFARLLDRLLIRLGIRQPRDMWEIFGEIIDRRYAPMTFWTGGTGSGKSNGCAATRVNGERPTAIDAFDFSGPLLGAVQDLERRRPGSTITWTPQGTVGLDLFQGTPREVARRWTAAFPSMGGVDQYKRAMRKRMDRAIVELDAEDIERDMRPWIDRLDPKWRKKTCHICQEPIKGHGEAEGLEGAKGLAGKQELLDELARTAHEPEPYEDEVTNLDKSAIESWLLRLEDLEADLAPTALGHDLDLADALSAGKTVFCHIDAAVQTGTVGILAGILVQEKIRCTRKVRGGFRYIVEEAGAMGDMIDAFILLFAAGRVRGVYIDIINQFLGALPQRIRANIDNWVLFSQEDEQAKRMAAERTGLQPEAFDKRVLKRFHAWLKSGAILKEGSFPRAPEAAYEIDYDDDEDEETTEVPVWGPAGPHSHRQGTGEAASRRPGPGAPGPGRVIEVEEIHRDAEPGRWEPEQLVAVVRPIALPAGRKHAPAYCVGDAWPGTERRARRFEMWDKLDGTWDENADWVWTSPSRNRGYGKASYANRGGWNSHFLFWAWNLLENRLAGRPTDLFRFYLESPEIPQFVWPAEGSSELTVLEALKEWMARPFGSETGSFPVGDPRRGVKLAIDHCCPGFPNTLCQNHRHHQLRTWRLNSQLRWQRRSGEVHDEAPSPV